MSRRPQIASVSEAARALHSMGDLMRWAVSRFGQSELVFGHATVDALDEAWALMRWTLQLPPEDPDRWLNCNLTPSERKAFLALVEARCRDRVPAAYLTGEVWLRGMRFRCDARALVPRSLLAEAIDTALGDWLDDQAVDKGWPQRILDLCTGGGSLAVFAADRFPRASVLASDIDEQALTLARENIALHDLTPRIQMRQGDLLEPLANERFDLIICNPPYVNAQSMKRLPAEFRAEPQHALAGGPDGMDIIRRLIERAGLHLNKGGMLLLEIGHEADHFENAFPHLEFTYLPVTAGERMVVLVHAEHLAVPARARRARSR